MGLSLKQRLIRDIQHSGPLSVPSFMQICLFDPHQGYYTHNARFESEGDFLTAPRLNQAFGEMIGLWFYPLITKALKSGPISIVEIGGGNGQLLRDISNLLRALLPNHAGQINYVYIEASETLLQQQCDSFSEANGYMSLKDLKIDHPVFLLGNEVFDCLGAHQYIRSGNGSFERVIGIDPNNHECLSFGLIPALGIQPPLGCPDGVIYEYSPAQQSLWYEIASLVDQSKGAALFFDYGHEEGDPSFGDTLQALSAHTKQDPLSAPGLDDLTQWVDFSSLTAITNSYPDLLSHLSHQGAFLKSMGIKNRLNALGQKHPERASSYERIYERLCADHQMGRLFKVIGAINKSLLIPDHDQNFDLR